MSDPDDPRRRRRKREAAARRELRRADVHAVALHLFARRGFHETSMADVAREAGLSLTALYEITPGKEDLYLAVVDEAFTHLLPGMARVEGEGGDVRSRLRIVIDELLAAIWDHPDAFALYARGPGGVPAEVRERRGDPFARYFEQLVGWLSEVIAGAASEQAEPALRARSVALALVAAVVALAGDADTSGDADARTRTAAELGRIADGLLGLAPVARP